MLRNVAIKALVLLVSACLFPAAGMAIEGNRSIRAGRLGDGIEAYVNISSADGRMSAVPQIRIKEKPENTMRGAADGKEEEAKTLTKILPEGGISYSNGVKLIDQVREAVKRRKQEKAGVAKASGLAMETAPGEEIDICGSCDFRSRLEGIIRR